MYEENKITELVGQVMSKVENVEDSELVFTSVLGKKWKLHHNQDCCEGFKIEDVCGDLEDLIGVPIVQALESKQYRDREAKALGLEDHDQSSTWTFYKFRTIKGSVTVRFCGYSNGYYSESVSFARVK